MSKRLVRKLKREKKLATAKDIERDNPLLAELVIKIRSGICLTSDELTFTTRYPNVIKSLVRYHEGQSDLQKKMAIKRQQERENPPSRPKNVCKVDKIPFWKSSKSFYATEVWKKLRYETLKKSDGRCECCGVSSKDGARLRVDHIRSISSAPHLKAEPTNLQVLCNDCNWGKGGQDSTDCAI